MLPFPCWRARPSSGCGTIEKSAGETAGTLGAHLLVVSPPSDRRGLDKPGNNDSLAFQVSCCSRTFLLDRRHGAAHGDSPARRIRPKWRTPTSLKVGEHGSKTSQAFLPFLDTVRPAVAIVSAGYENSFGHPHPDVLKRLEERHAAVLRTDLDGLVTVSTDGRRLWYDMMSWEEVK